MTYLRKALALLLVAALGGCASTAVVTQATGLADAGIAYAAAAQEVLPITRERFLDWQSDSLLEELPGSTFCKAEEIADEETASDDCKELIASFDKAQDKQVKLAKHFSDLGAHAHALGAYFQSLKILAEYDSAASASNAAGRAIDRINDLNASLEKEIEISAKKKDAWSALAGLVGDTVKAARLRERLQADAAVIGKAIDLQDAVLAANVALLAGLDEAARDEQFRESVRTPYLTGAIDDAGLWRTARLAALTPLPEVVQLRSLTSASQQLRDVWEDILSGSGDPAAAQRVFDDVARTLDVLNDVRRANGANP